MRPLVATADRFKPDVGNKVWVLGEHTAVNLIKAINVCDISKNRSLICT